MELEIEKSLVASTGHIRWATSKWLDADADACHLYVTAYEEGWRVYVGSAPLEPDPRIPTDLYVLLKLAADNSCKWLRLDCDGETLTGYQEFNWEAEKKVWDDIAVTRLTDQPVVGESEVKPTVGPPDQEPARQLYMRIIAPDGKLLGDTPISQEFELQEGDKPEYELQDGAYGLHEYCKAAFGSRAGGDVAFRIGKLLLEQLSVSKDKLATSFGFTSQLLKTRPIPNCWPKDLLEDKQPADPKLVYADLSGLTSAQILAGADEMAHELYKLEGWSATGGSFYGTNNPRMQRVWQQVKIAYERLTATDLDEVAFGLDEEKSEEVI